MKIETKYNINQEVWFIEDNKVKNEEILKLTFSKDGSNESIFYYFKEKSNSANWERSRKEEEVFATKQELIDSL